MRASTLMHQLQLFAIWSACFTSFLRICCAQLRSSGVHYLRIHFTTFLIICAFRWAAPQHKIHIYLMCNFECAQYQNNYFVYFALQVMHNYLFHWAILLLHVWQASTLLWLHAKLSCIDSSSRSLQAAQLPQKFCDAQELHLTYVAFNLPFLFIYHT